MVRAGLALLRALEERNDSIQIEYRVRLSARVGIHTGSVVLSGTEPVSL